ncbi:MAG: CinA family protein [Sciscionella sp.]
MVTVASLLATLRDSGETVATAESLTGGAICAALTEVPGSSAVVRGGLVVYATELKSSLAGVDAAMLDRYGAVHPEVAVQLAAGVRARCGATWGLGLTGVAGPGRQDGVGAGTVYLALVGGADDTRRSLRTLQVEGDRHTVRAAAVRAAMELLGGTKPSV